LISIFDYKINYEIAVKDEPNCIRYIKDEDLNEDLCELALRTIKNGIHIKFDIIPERFRTEKIMKIGIEELGYNEMYKYVNNVTKEHIEFCGKFLLRLPIKEWTEDLIIKAVNDPSSVEKVFSEVPDENKTEKLCSIAMKTVEKYGDTIKTNILKNMPFRIKKKFELGIL